MFWEKFVIYFNLVSCQKLEANNYNANMTKYYKASDLTLNGYPSQFVANHFNECYLTRVFKQLKDVMALEEVDVQLCLSLLKSLPAQLLVKLYN